MDPIRTPKLSEQKELHLNITLWKVYPCFELFSLIDHEIIINNLLYIYI